MVKRILFASSNRKFLVFGFAKTFLIFRDFLFDEIPQTLFGKVSGLPIPPSLATGTIAFYNTFATCI